MTEEEEENFPPEIQRLPTEFSFRELTNLKAFVSESQPEYATTRTGLLAVANIYGYVFIGMPDGLKVLTSADLLEAGKKNLNVIDSAVATIDLRNPPNWIGINSDNLTLSVCCKTSKGPQILFFDIRNIINKSKPTKTPFHSIYLNKDPNSYVVSMQWNPSPVWPNLLAICLSSGSFHLLSVEDTATEIAIRPDNFGATTVCWSPKGKQMVVGKKDGNLLQFTQKLEVKRSITVTNVIDSPVRACDILWLSTHHIASAYVATAEEEEAHPNLFLADIPSKTEQRDIIWKNYEDPCFGMNESRDPRYFLEFIDQWQMFINLSSNSTDTAVIAKNKQSQMWEIWTLDDSSRATLPFSEYTEDDQAPIGSAIITTATERIIVDDVRECEPMPIFLILTSEGLLCMYHMINLMPDYESVVSIPSTLDITGERAPVGTKGSGTGEGDNKPSGSQTKQKLSAKPSISSMSTPKLGTSSLENIPTPSTTTTTKKSLFLASTPAVGKLPPFTEGPSIIQGSATKPPIKPPLMRETLLKASSFAPAKHTALDETVDTVFDSSRTGSTETVFTKSSMMKQLPKPPIAKQIPPEPSFTQQPNLKPSQPAPATKPNVTSATQPKINEPFHTGLGQNKTPLMKTKSILPGTSVSTFPPSKVLPAKSGTTRTIPEQQPSKSGLSGVRKSSSFRGSESDFKISLDDVTSFDKELLEFQSTICTLEDVQVTIGGNDEKVKLLKEIDDASSFSKEISQTAKELSNEIQESTMSMSSLISETKDVERKQNQATVGAYRALLYRRPLDRTQRQKLEAIRGLHQYVVSCVREANIALDAQWEEANKRKKSLMGSRDNRRGNLQGGEWEAAYQGLVNNMKILHNQEMKIMLLSQQLDRLRLEKTSTRSSSRNRDTTSSKVKSGTDLQMLADSLLLHREPTTSSAQKSDTVDVMKTSKQTKTKMSPKKQAQLGQMLANRRVAPVRSSSKLPSQVLRPASKSSKNKEKAQSRSGSESQSDRPSSPRAEEESPYESESGTPDSMSSSAPSSVGGFTFGTNADPAKADMGFAHRKPEIYSSMPGTTAPSMIPQGSATLAYGAPKTVSAETKRRELSNFPTSGNMEAASNLNNPPQVVNIQKLQEQALVQPRLPDKFQPKPEVPAGAVEVVQTVLNTVKAEQEQKPKTWNFEPDKAPPSFLSTAGRPETAGAFAIGKSASDGGKLFKSGFNLEPTAAVGSVPSLLTGHTTLGPKTSSPASFGATAASEIIEEKKSSDAALLRQNLFSTDAAISSLETKNIFGSVKQQAPMRSSSATAIFSRENKDPSSSSGSKPSTSVPTNSVQPNIFSDDKKAASPFTGLFKTPSSTTPFGGFAAQTASGDNQKQGDSGSSPSSPGLTFSLKTTPDVSTASPTITVTVSNQGPSLTSFTNTPSATPPPSMSALSIAPSNNTDTTAATTPASDASITSTDAIASATISHARSSSSPHQSKTDSKQSTGLFGGITKTGFGSTGNISEASTGFLRSNTDAPTSSTSFAPSTATITGSGDTNAATAQSVFGSGATSSTSVFGNVGTAGNNTQSSISLTAFGKSPSSDQRATTVSTTSTEASVFGTVTATSSTENTTTPSASESVNVSSAPATTTSVFGASTSATSVFGNVSTATPAFGSASSVPAFGGATTAPPGFGSTTTAFGSVTSSGETATGAPGFGATATPGFGTTTAPPAFGSSTAFGATATPPAFGATTTPSAFGATTTASAFGSTTTPSPFGVATTASAFGAATTPSAFGATTTPSVFGATTAVSAFGAATPSAAFGAATTPSVFGAAAAPSVFGAATTASVFGTASSTGPFGGFGASTQDKSVFGASAFGQKKTTAFGQTPFGGGFASTQPTSTSQSSPFGGGFLSGIGGQPGTDAANKNPFQIGGNAEQGDNSSTSLFGNSGAKSFQATGQNQQQQSAFGFSSPSAGVGAQGFGGFNKPQQSGFGAAPAFGSSATFGSPPAFGSTSGGSTFGGGFGSQPASTGGAFGQTASGGFSSFASSETPGFGNLANQSGGFGSPQQQQPSSFGGFGSNTQKSPSFSGWR
ncbi:nuclear pore complex protein Nup214-like isoform X2 [Styela clava]